ncbi:MAG: hypothetical protein ACR2N4_05205 [Jatrophihabitans sp.]
MNELPVAPETPAEFKQALRDATRLGGFDKLSDLTDKANLSRGTLSPAFSETKPMPTEATIVAVVQAIHGDIGAWLARSRRVAEPATPNEDAPRVESDHNAPTDDPARLPVGTRVTPPFVPDRGDLLGLDEPAAATTPQPLSGILRAWRRASKHLVWTGAGAGLVVVLALAAVLVWLLKRDHGAPERTLVVQNEVAVGASGLIEDDSPSYLAAHPIAKCANVPGCKLTGTDLHTGDTVQAVCQLQGALLTNADIESAGIKTNPNVAASALWYGIRWTDGRRGLINEVYIRPSYRGGLGLPGC